MTLRWQPSEARIRDANITRYIEFLNEKYSLNIKGYEELYQWSIHSREEFWSSVWDFGKVIYSRPYETVLQDSPTMIGAKWFVGSRLNFAENLLRCRDDKVALVFKGEGCWRGSFEARSGLAFVGKWVPPGRTESLV